MLKAHDQRTTGIVIVMMMLYSSLVPVSACSAASADELPDMHQDISPSHKESATARDTQDIREEMSRLFSEIEKTIGTASCTSSSQCGALPVGVKACGGYSRYLPFSAVNTDVDYLKNLSAQFNELSTRHNELIGAISDCMIQPPPTPVCMNGMCQLQRSGSPPLPNRR